MRPPAGTPRRGIGGHLVHCASLLQRACRDVKRGTTCSRRQQSLCTSAPAAPASFGALTVALLPCQRRPFSASTLGATFLPRSAALCASTCACTLASAPTLAPLRAATTLPRRAATCRRTCGGTLGRGPSSAACARSPSPPPAPSPCTCVRTMWPAPPTLPATCRAAAFLHPLQWG